MLRENSTVSERSPLRNKSFSLALRVVKLYQYLILEKKEYVLSKQLLRSGTNPGAMIRECQNAESAADFIHKLSIALKETNETEYWLELLHQAGFLNETEYKSINADTVEVGKMITSSIKTKKKNLTIKVLSIIGLISSVMYFFG